MVSAIALLVLSGFLLPGVGNALDAGVEEVDDCLRSNLPEKTSRQRVDLECKDRTGGVRTLDANLFWRRGKDDRSETMIEVEGPPEDRGSRYLAIAHKDRTDTWVCLPELQRVRRIHPRSADGQLFCTDFSYEDIQHLQRVPERARAKRLSDATLDGRDVRMVHSDTSELEGSSYHHIIYQVDAQTCLPLKIEFFETAEDLRKRLTTDPDSFIRSGESWVAQKVRMEDLGTGTTSQILVKDIELEADVPARMFTLSNMERRCR
ncbi:MAG: outer membrane lipoprotein-sorting protein [Myxococcota bacterium]